MPSTVRESLPLPTQESARCLNDSRAEVGAFRLMLREPLYPAPIDSYMMSEWLLKRQKLEII